jgi:hypothetical protein
MFQRHVIVSKAFLLTPFYVLKRLLTVLDLLRNRYRPSMTSIENSLLLDTEDGGVPNAVVFFLFAVIKISTTTGSTSTGSQIYTVVLFFYLFFLVLKILQYLIDYFGAGIFNTKHILFILH